MAEPTLNDAPAAAHSAAELRASRDAWRTCASTMATACMRGDAIAAIEVWRKRALEEERKARPTT